MLVRFSRKPVEAALAAIESALAARDTSGLEMGYLQLARCPKAMLAERSPEAGPRLAALLARMPPWQASVFAVLIGALVEWHADPLSCAPPILDGLRDSLTGAIRFAQLWADRFGPDEDLPSRTEISDEVQDRLGHDSAASWASAYQAWVALHRWEMAAVAVLADPSVRQALVNRDELVELTRALRPRYGDLQCTQRALLLLDDEPLLVLDRATRKAFRMRMSGIAGNYQLQTLLAAVLIGGGHLPGIPPAPRAVTLCSDGDLDPANLSDLPVEREWFNFSEPSGRWIWSEVTPSQIPIADGIRQVVLDPPVFCHAFTAVRFLPRVPGRLELDEVMEPEQSARYFASVHHLMSAQDASRLAASSY